MTVAASIPRSWRLLWGFWPRRNARAVPTTDAGAARITGALGRYLGRVPGVIETVADGGTYRLTLNAAPLLDLLLRRIADATAAGSAPAPQTGRPDIFSVEAGTARLSDFMGRHCRLRAALTRPLPPPETPRSLS